MAFRNVIVLMTHGLCQAAGAVELILGSTASRLAAPNECVALFFLIVEVTSHRVPVNSAVDNFPLDDPLHLTALGTLTL